MDNCPQMRSCTVYPWGVYTHNDINMYSTRHPNTTSIPMQYKRKVLSIEKADMNKISTSLLDGLKPKLLNQYSVVFVHKAYPNPKNPTVMKYLYLTLHLNVTQWFLAIFMEHRLNTQHSQLPSLL